MYDSYEYVMSYFFKLINFLYRYQKKSIHMREKAHSRRIGEIFLLENDILNF